MTDTVNRPGIKTTEFWMATLVPFLVAIVAGVLSLFGIDVSDETILAVVSPAVLYMMGRIFNKKKAADIEIEKTKAGATIAATAANTPTRAG